MKSVYEFLSGVENGARAETSLNGNCIGMFLRFDFN